MTYMWGEGAGGLKVCVCLVNAFECVCECLGVYGWRMLCSVIEAWSMVPCTQPHTGSAAPVYIYFHFVHCFRAAESIGKGISSTWTYFETKLPLVYITGNTSCLNG